MLHWYYQCNIYPIPYQVGTRFLGWFLSFFAKSGHFHIQEAPLWCKNPFWALLTLMKVLGLIRGFLHHKVSPWPQKWPELTKKHPKSSHKDHVPLCEGIQQVLHRQPTTLFHRMTLGKGIRAQEGIPTSQSGPMNTKLAWIGHKLPKITQKISRFALWGEPTAVTSVTNHSISLNDPKWSY